MFYLTVPHPHSGELLVKVLNDCMESWGIDQQQVLMITTDNAGNTIKFEVLDFI